MTHKDRVFALRLLKLARFLDTLPPERFYFGRWASAVCIDDCGTTACAMGWATTIPAFRKLGLRLFNNNGFPWVGMEGDDSFYWQSNPEKAGAAIFGLDEEEFSFLFLPREDLDGEREMTDQEEMFGRTAPSKTSSAKEVADHIRYFVKYKYGDVAAAT